jgi:hypothetical protein
MKIELYDRMAKTQTVFLIFPGSSGMKTATWSSGKTIAHENTNFLLFSPNSFIL